MREYEYIVIAIEEFLCDNIAAIVCLENYNNCQLYGGFRKFFESYRRLHEAYQEKAESFKNSEIEEKQKFHDECEQNRNKMLDAFIIDANFYSKNIDFKSEVDNYYSKLDEEDIITPEKRIYVHKYLLSLISNNSKEKEGERDGNKA